MGTTGTNRSSETPGTAGTVRARHVVTPHATSPSVLHAQRQIYRQGRTPVADERGGLRALDVRPSDARTTSDHLGEVQTRYGEAGLARSVRGLGVTRGWDFALRAVDLASERVKMPALATLHGAHALGQEPEGDIVGARVGSTVGSALDRSTSAGGLSPDSQDRLGAALGQNVSDIRIHDDSAAHRAARMLNARALTIGQSIYFDRGEYRPSTSAGFHLLAHEVAHAVQQRGAARPSTSELQVSAPAGTSDQEADRAADAVTSGRDAAPISSGPSGVARVMRAISFTGGTNVITTNDPTAQEDTAGATFQIAQGATAAPHFRWDADVTINGNAGDPFGDFVIGPHQVVRAFWLNIWWSSGANRTHRTSSVTTPIRDSTAPGNTWYHDAFVSPAFGASGDVRSTTMNDTPGVRRQPYANPLPPRTGSRGTFNWGMAFVAYVSAQDTTRGTGAAAFQTLSHVYWNMSVSGRFDGTRPTAADRVTATGGGKTNASRVFDGADASFPTMHGGAQFNTEANANLTTT